MSRKPVIYFTRCIYYGLRPCWGPVTSSKMAAILDENYQKTAIFMPSHVEYDKIKHCCFFVNILSFFLLIKRLKTRIDTPLLMTSYIVTIATDAHLTCIKMCLRNIGTVTENGRCRRKIGLENSRKTLLGKKGWQLPILPVCLRVSMFWGLNVVPLKHF